MSRRRRRPDPEPVTARPPRWLLFGSVGLVAVLVGPPIVGLISGEGSLSMLALAFWPVALLALIWRSRLHVDGDGVAFTYLGTRHVAWSSIEALVHPTSAFNLRGPHLRVSDGRPVPLNPLWRAEGGAVHEALAPWLRAKRVRVDGTPDDGTRRRPRLLLILVLVAVGALLGVLVGNLVGG